MQFLNELENLLAERKETQPENSYTASLFRDGQDRILKKVVEEAGETVLAAKNKDRREIIHETADLLFHTIVMLVNEGVSLEEIVEELETRHR
jgi:phosphoribosyl-ATP pyrophosphohydrolase/phosphoribosyl-ATP pyrophosphohydrolase/phosphoribosyl-AMP cyclohydrolase